MIPLSHHSRPPSYPDRFDGESAVIGGAVSKASGAMTGGRGGRGTSEMALGGGREMEGGNVCMQCYVLHEGIMADPCRL